MKPQFKLEEIYLDLSKLSEEQIKQIPNILKNANERFIGDDYNTVLYHTWKLFHKIDNGKCWVVGTQWVLKDKTELTYSQFLDMMGVESEEVLQVENCISIEELTKLCNDYNRNTLKITNLERDLEYKRSWSKESIAIKEIHKEVSHAKAIKENAKSKLQEIGIVF